MQTRGLARWFDEQSRGSRAQLSAFLATCLSTLHLLQRMQIISALQSAQSGGTLLLP